MIETPSGVLPLEEGRLRARDGTSLHYRRAAPAGPARGRLVVIHGFAEHGGRYGPLVQAAAARGLDAWAVDLRGHGRSDGARAFVERFEDYLQDVSAVLDLAARDRSDGPPVWLLGHSMGGLVVTRFVEEQPSGVRGFVLSSPFVAMKMRVPAWKRVLAHGLSRVVPSFALPTDLDPAHLASDPEVGRLYMADPLVLKAATARWFTETLGAQRAAFAKAGTVALPALLMHGADDPIADPEGTRRLFAGLGSTDKELEVWPALRHEPFNERSGATVIERVLAWLEGRSGKG